jgi:DNA replicative helicase MCM subunit Mcm2 (Cdc46/Mcm family)
MTDDSYTDSAFRDKLTKEVQDTKEIRTMSQGFHIFLNSSMHRKMIEQLRLTSFEQIKLAVSNAVVRHFTHIKAETIYKKQSEFTLKQCESRLNMRGYLSQLPPNPVTISIKAGLFPYKPLSKFTASHVGKVIQADVTVVGPSAKKAYVDKVVTPEGTVSWENYNAKRDGHILQKIHNDAQILLVEEISESQKELRKITVNCYGELVGQFETGDRVRITGTYMTEKGHGDNDRDEPANLYIDAIHIDRLEEKEEVRLTKEQIDEFKQIISVEADDYLRDLTRSFAPQRS